jgi:hypothetical protein
MATRHCQADCATRTSPCKIYSTRFVSFNFPEFLILFCNSEASCVRNCAVVRARYRASANGVQR